MEVELGALITISKNLHGECVCSVATTLGSGAARVLVPVWNISTSRHCRLLLWVCLVTWGSSCEWNSREKKVGVIGYDFHKDLGLLLPNEGKEDFLWSSGTYWDIF